MATTRELRADAFFRGKRVSKAHWIVLTAAAAARVAFVLNSGRRLMAEQWQLYRHPPVGTPLVAYPAPNAPHIKQGSAAHATDVGTGGNGAVKLAVFYRGHGVSVTFNVPGEPWHSIPISEGQLLAAAQRLSDPLESYPADERRWIREYDGLRRKKLRSAKQRERMATLQRVMTAKRKAIWRAAQTSGWDRLERRARYKSLSARTN